MPQFLFAVAGWIFVGLAILGAALPLMPATPFALAAAACFARSSTELHRRLVQSALLGSLIRDWNEGHGVRRETKRSLLYILLASAALGSIVCWYRDQSLLAIGASVCIGTLVIVLLPARGSHLSSATGSSLRIHG